jgi:hypothetical protein
MALEFCGGDHIRRRNTLVDGAEMAVFGLARLLYFYYLLPAYARRSL